MSRFRKGSRFYDRAKLIQVLNYIRTYQEVHGYAPTVREIAENNATTSTSVARYWLSRMVDEKMIERGPRGAARAIRIIYQEEPNERTVQTN